jgi:hypothetical protein
VCPDFRAGATAGEPPPPDDDDFDGVETEIIL